MTSRFTRGDAGYVDGHSLLTYYELCGTDLSPQSLRYSVIEDIASSAIFGVLSARLCCFNGELCAFFYPLLGTVVPRDTHPDADFDDFDDLFNHGSDRYWRFP